MLAGVWLSWGISLVEGGLIVPPFDQTAAPSGEGALVCAGIQAGIALFFSWHAYASPPFKPRVWFAGAGGHKCRPHISFALLDPLRGQSATSLCVRCPLSLWVVPSVFAAADISLPPCVYPAVRAAGAWSAGRFRATHRCNLLALSCHGDVIVNTFTWMDQLICRRIYKTKIPA